LGGYFISYRKLEQWIAACRTLIRFCRNLEALNAFWSLIVQEAQRYTEEGFSRLEAIWQERKTYLCDRLSHRPQGDCPKGAARSDRQQT
jgi:hypothetical protein